MLQQLDTNITYRATNEVHISVKPYKYTHGTSKLAYSQDFVYPSEHSHAIKGIQPVGVEIFKCCTKFNKHIMWY